MKRVKPVTRITASDIVRGMIAGQSPLISYSLDELRGFIQREGKRRSSLLELLRARACGRDKLDELVNGELAYMFQSGTHAGRLRRMRFNDKHELAGERLERDLIRRGVFPKYQWFCHDMMCSFHDYILTLPKRHDRGMVA